MRRILIAYVGALLAVGALDGVWLSLTGGPLYRHCLGDLLAPSFRVAPAAVFYPLYVAGLCRLAIMPALSAGGWRRAMTDGAVLGLIAYATYDLTNQATLVHWSGGVTVIDIAWGLVLSAAGASAGYLAAARLTPRTLA